MLDDICHNVEDGALSKFGRTRLFVSCYEFLRSQGITIYQKADIRDLFVGLAREDRRLWNGRHGINGLVYDFKNFKNNNTRMVKQIVNTENAETDPFNESNPA